jgi:hypothetical protein
MKPETTTGAEARIAFKPLVRRLRALARAEHDDLSVGDEAADRITELDDLLFALGAMEEAPCFCCGYSGPGYFQSGKHKWAERHHVLKRDPYA